MSGYKWWLDLPVNSHDKKLLQDDDEQICPECFQVIPKNGECGCLD